VKRVEGQRLIFDRTALYRELDLRRRRAQIAARHALLGPPAGSVSTVGDAVRVADVRVA
jgi:hypothetical protein